GAAGRAGRGSAGGRHEPARDGSARAARAARPGHRSDALRAGLCRDPAAGETSACASGRLFAAIRPRSGNAQEGHTMKQTSKVLVGIGIILLVIVAAGMWFLYANLGSLVAGIIER